MQPAGEPVLELPAGYVGQQACAPCHQEIYAALQELGMGRSWTLASEVQVIEDYTNQNTFYHSKSGYYYTMLQRDGKFLQQRYLLGPDKKPIHMHEEEVTYVVGSGNHARSYLRHHPNGVVTQLPITWYSQERRWGMSPGYDIPDHPDFTRAIPQGCVFCHTAYPRLEPERAEDTHYFPHAISGGIGCERCHGPGEVHVQVASQGEPIVKLRQTIYNPARDSQEAQRNVCYQCHMESSVNSLGTRVVRPDRAMFSFRPDQSFSGYAVQFSYEGTDPGRFQVVQHADLMEASRCFQQSQGKMTCTTCHDPHRKISSKQAIAYYRQRCVECHATGKLRGHTRVQLAGDCTSCHMPRGVPTNGGHTVFTNHRIGIHSKTAAPAARPPGSVRHRLTFRETAGDLSETEKLFFLGAAYLDAPVEELGPRPDLAKHGVELMTGFLSQARSQEDSVAQRSQAEALLAKGHQALNELPQALRHYENSVALKQDQLQSHYGLATLYASRGDLALSEQHFSKVLQYFPKHVPSLHGLGALAEAAGRQKEAVRYFEQAIALFPNALASHYRMAQIFLGQSQVSRGAEALEKCLSLNPRYLPALVDMGHVLSRQNRLAESRQYFEQALKIDPSREDIYGALSVVLDLQGNSEESISLLQRAVSKGIAGELTYMNLGNLFARKGDFTQAIRSFEAIRRKSPGNSKALFALGICHLKAGELTKGRALLEQVVQLDPENTEARQVLRQLPER